MTDVLREIIRRKAQIVGERAARLPLVELSAQVEGLPPCRGFADALQTRMAAGRAAVIAEIKRASPSKGLLRDPYDPAAIASSYAQAGASCLSVLTDEDFFQGCDAHLIAAREACALPVLRKDFIIDAWQVYESRRLGADCILLICAAIGDASLFELSALARELGLDVLVEVHDAAELERAQRSHASLIGINNRNLSTFVTDVQTTVELASGYQDERLLISESGIHQREQIARIQAAGVNAFLIGEAFMCHPEPGLALQHLFGG